MSAWVIKSTASLDIKVKDIAFCPAYTKWVAIGAKISDGTPIAIESSNGLSWTPLITGFETSSPFRAVRGIDLGVSRGLIVIYAADTIIEMDSAGVWTEVASAITAGTTSNRLIYLPGAGFCLVRASLSPDDVITVYVSNDGVTWTGPNTVVSIASVGGGGNSRALIRFGLHFIILYSHNFSPNNSRVNYSNDGFAWNQASMAGYTILSGMVFPPGKNILTGRKTTDLESKVFSGDSNYANWLEISTALNGGGFIEYNANIDKIILINSDGNSSISSDGIVWESKTHPALTGYTAFTAGYTIVGSDELLLVMTGSTDGIGDNPFSEYTVDAAIDPPTNPTVEVDDPESASFTFDVNNPPEQNVDGYAIVRVNSDGEETLVGTVLNPEIPDTLVFEDNFIPEPGIYWYEIFAYYLEDEIISEKLEFEVIVPNIIMVGSGGIDLGGAADIVYISDPSGIYTLVSGKTHDTLYERMTGITTQNVKIPDPFIETGYHGD